MKTIEVSDEMYDKLIDLANEMTTQDPRGTRMPHMFQIRTKYKEYDWGLNGDNRCYIDDEGEEIESHQDLINYLNNNDIEYPSDIEKMWEDSWWVSEDKNFINQDLNDFLNNVLPNLKECSFSWRYKYENMFFTEKGCKKHIELNHYHYSDPVDYLNHAWRNPEMELISTFLCGLVNKKMYI